MIVVLVGNIECYIIGERVDVCIRVYFKDIFLV